MTARFRGWTDGACVLNPGGPGGWAFVLTDGKTIREECGGIPTTTSQRAELAGIFECVRACPEGSRLDIYTDSKYAEGVLSLGWKAKANTDLIGQIKSSIVLRRLDVRVRWIRRDTDMMNVRADELAAEGLASLKIVAKSPFGSCPICGAADDIKAVFSEQWGSCSVHWLKWLVTDATLGGQEQSEYEAAENADYLATMREVRPIFP